MSFTIIVATSVITLLVFVRLLFRSGNKKLPSLHNKGTSPEEKDNWNYVDIREMLQKDNTSLPVMMVDLDAFEYNVKTIVSICRKYGKQLRIATKSIRCPYLIKLIANFSSGVLSGFMCYSIDEAEFLYEQGHDDFFVAYPTVQFRDIEKALKLVVNGAKVCLTVDSTDQVKKLNEVIDTVLASSTSRETMEKVILRVSIDLDMSYKLGPKRLGAHRSRINTIEKFEDVAKEVLKSVNLKLAGCMGYEASVAGLPDDNPHAPLPNFVIRLLKGFFYKQCLSFRGEVLKWCFKNDVQLEFFNGGRFEFLI